MMNIIILKALIHNNNNSVIIFFFNDPAATEIYTLSLHDALPIYSHITGSFKRLTFSINRPQPTRTENILRSEERFSRNAETDLVCRLLLEKKKFKFIKRIRNFLLK